MTTQETCLSHSGEETLQDKGWYKGKEDKCNDPITQPPVGQSAISVDPPDVFTPGSSRFSAECDPSQPPNWAWTIVHNGERHVMHKLYPTIPGCMGMNGLAQFLVLPRVTQLEFMTGSTFSSWLTFHQMFQGTTPLSIAIRITIHTHGKGGLGMTGSWSSGPLAYKFMNRLLIFC